jgi:hypothetical protein
MNTASPIFLYAVQKKELLLSIPPFLSERTTGSLTKPNARTIGVEVRVMFPSFIESAVTGASLDAFD